MILRLLIITSLALTSVQMYSQDRQADSLILIDIYNDLGGEDWSTSDNWLTFAPLEDWYGVKIKDNRVSELNLSNIGIKGRIPSSLYDLDALRKLKFFTGEINQSLTDEIYKLQNLSELTIQNCGLTGTIPYRMDSLSFLTRLDLARNKLEGELPLLPSRLSRLDLWFNTLTGEIPASYANLDMWQVNISSNQLTGSYDLVRNWTGIDGFNGSNNDWDEHTLPDWLDQMPEMRSFHCRKCNIVGDIPEYDWSGSPEFYQMVVNTNAITGDIGRLRLDSSDVNTSWIDLSNNQLSGTIPTHLIKSMTKLFLNGNDYTEVTTFDFHRLGDFRIQGNKFLLSALIDELPSVINHENVSKVTFHLQRSPFENEDINVGEGEMLMLSPDEEVAGASYQWFYNNFAVQGATSQTFTKADMTLSDQGRYWCVMTHPDLVDEDGELVPFKGREWQVSIEMISNTKNEFHSISIFPNPTTDYLQIDLPIKYSGAIYQLYRSDGIMVSSSSFDKTERIKMTDLPRGTYLMKIVYGGYIDSQVVVKH